MDDLIIAQQIREAHQRFEDDVHERRHRTFWYRLEAMVLGWFNLPPRVLERWRYRVIVDEYHFERIN